LSQKLNDGPIVVIGAGSTGSSTSYHLAKLGQPVVLIDKGQVASGMTSLSTAVVRTHYSNQLVTKMALYSLEILRNFSSIGSSGFTQSGYLVLASTQLRKAMEANVKMHEGSGVRTEVLDKSDAMRRWPEINFDDCEYITYEPESGYADPVSTATSYASQARKLGAEILTGKEVARLEIQDKLVRSVVLSDGTKIACSKVMLCTNSWTNKLLSKTGIEKKTTTSNLGWRASCHDPKKARKLSRN
jgi:sarcosine oxidase, subunit beta